MTRATASEPLDAQERERLCRLTASQAAELLRTPRKTLYDKLARHGLSAEAYRPSNQSHQP